MRPSFSASCGRISFSYSAPAAAASAAARLLRLAAFALSFCFLGHGLLPSLCRLAACSTVDSTTSWRLPLSRRLRCLCVHLARRVGRSWPERSGRRRRRTSCRTAPCCRPSGTGRPAARALPHDGQKNVTFDSCTGISLLSRPPCGCFWLRRTCLYTRFTPSTSALPVGAIDLDHAALAASPRDRRSPVESLATVVVSLSNQHAILTPPRWPG